MWLCLRIGKYYAHAIQVQEIGLLGYRIYSRCFWVMAVKKAVSDLSLFLNFFSLDHFQKTLKYMLFPPRIASFVNFKAFFSSVSIWRGSIATFHTPPGQSTSFQPKLECDCHQKRLGFPGLVMGRGACDRGWALDITTWGDAIALSVFHKRSWDY